MKVLQSFNNVVINWIHLEYIILSEYQILYDIIRLW